MNIDHKEAAKVTELYRHFDADGRLLYVGISLSVLHRLRGHRRKSVWFSLIANITIERFDTRAQALAAERLAIQTERPRFNIMLAGMRLPQLPPPVPLAERLRARREARIARREKVT